MKCYNCGCEITEHSFCVNCGVDITLYRKIIRTSNYFYNQGLDQARVRDLSGAIVSLRQSLKFNKSNIRARNLLGLVYFEMGEVPAALSEWVISKNLKPQKNLAAEYLNLVQSNTGKLENINTNIKKYNTALEYCKQPDGIDMAVIQLKGVVRECPNFVRARQLLALCYLKAKSAERAKRELEKCKAIDVNNTTTLRYLNEAELILNPPEDGKKRKKQNSEETDAVTAYMSGNEYVIQPPTPVEKKGPGTILNIIFGIAIGFAVAFFLVLPAKIQQERTEATEEAKNISNQLDAKNITITEYEAKMSEQENQIKTLTESLGAYAGTEGTLLSMENLLKASAIYLETPENFLEVAEYIIQVDESTWTDETSENYIRLYNAIKVAIGPAVCDAYYLDGNNAYKNAQYKDAIAYLESAVFFDSEDRDALYMLAASYAADERIDDAIDTYKKVVERFPDTWHSQKSEQALEKLTVNESE